MKTRNEMNLQRLTAIDYRRTNASVPMLAQGLLNDVVDSVLTGVDQRFERGVELGDGQGSFGHDVIKCSASAPYSASFFTVL